MISSKLRSLSLLLGGIVITGLAGLAATDTTTRSLTSAEAANHFGATSGCGARATSFTEGCDDHVRCAKFFEEYVQGIGYRKMNGVTCHYFTETLEFKVCGYGWVTEECDE